MLVVLGQKFNELKRVGVLRLAKHGLAECQVGLHLHGVVYVGVNIQSARGPMRVPGSSRRFAGSCRREIGR